MKLNKTIYAITILILLCTPSRLVAQQSEYVPLAGGNTWSYEGTVEWTESVNKIKKSSITWKMKVEKRLKNGSFEVAVMRGHPADLCRYEPDKRPSRYLIVWRDNKYYEIRINNDFEKLINDEAYLSSKTDFNSLFLVAPLKKDLEFGNNPDMPRDDRMYEWVVDDEQRGRLFHVTGISAKKKLTKYRLIYRTISDHQIVDFAPFLGITRFIYVHHGTVSEVDVKLIEFRNK